MKNGKKMKTKFFEIFICEENFGKKNLGGKGWERLGEKNEWG